MIIIFVTCKNKSEAKKIGSALLKKRLAACVVVIPGVFSQYFWPPKKNRIAKSREAILLVKTLGKKFPQMEREVKRLHSYSFPCILEVPIRRAHQPYLKWLEGEINGKRKN